MRKLRIAFVSAGQLGHVGAYATFFAGRGHDVHWVTYDPPARDFGVPTHDISRGADAKRAGSKWRYLLSGLAARRVLRSLAPDIVHGHYVTSAGVVCLLAGFRPYVLTAHGSDVIAAGRSRLWRCVLRRAFGRAALVNAVSDQLAELVRALGVPAEKLLVATPGVDTKTFDYREPEVGRSPVRLLCTRTLAPVYDPGTILRACAILRDRGVDFRLTFAAGGPMETSLRNEAIGAGLRDRIEFLGGFANAALPGLLHEHDIYVSAAAWDGTSISLLEAMACGTFPVVSRTPSNRSWLEEGRTALMFDCGDAEELAEALRRAAGDPDLRRTAAAANRRVVEERGDRYGNMLRLERAYEVVADRPS